MKKSKTYIFLIIMISVASCKTRSTNPTVDTTATYKTLDEINDGQVYGSKCGIIGTDPILRTKSESFIIEMKIDSIKNWFNDSLNTIKQVYAAESLIRLFNSDSINLSTTEIKTIKDLKLSQKSILSCSGCVYNYKRIQELLFRFKLKEEK